MRGKRTDSGHTGDSSRITPAHAGKTRRFIFTANRKTDHPRACGENRKMKERCSVYDGSPPRMRGKRKSPSSRNCRTRITPAHAGKTENGGIQIEEGADHPRACGENISRIRSSCGFCGSPPRMRGKLHLTQDELASRRITPAHAGKTPRMTCSFSSGTDHPRACGENKDTGRKRFKQSGSPPRMRGKHELTEFRHSLSRITPAHAGKTFDLTITPCTISDHPRACGENQASFSHLRLKRGSPPRMRGKPADDFIRLGQFRITPAHAGKTLDAARSLRISTDHPRACGENMIL